MDGGLWQDPMPYALEYRDRERDTEYRACLHPMPRAKQSKTQSICHAFIYIHIVYVQ